MENKSIKLLVVDDEPEILYSFEKYYKYNNHTIQCCSNGTDALNFIKKEKFDIVILDYNMPEFSGSDICWRMKKFDQQIKIIILTGNYSCDAYNDSLCSEGLCPDGFIYKPIDFSELDKIIAGVIKGEKFYNASC